MIGNCSLRGSKSLTAISRPLLAPWASSAWCLMVPKGPPVFVFESKVPAECHLHKQIITKKSHSIHHKKKTLSWLQKKKHTIHHKSSNKKTLHPNHPKKKNCTGFIRKKNSQIITKKQSQTNKIVTKKSKQIITKIKLHKSWQKSHE